MLNLALISAVYFLLNCLLISCNSLNQTSTENVSLPQKPNKPIIVMKEKRFLLELLVTDSTPIAGYTIERSTNLEETNGKTKWTTVQTFRNKKQSSELNTWKKFALNKSVEFGEVFRVKSFNSAGYSEPSLSSDVLQVENMETMIENYVPAKPKYYWAQNGSLIVTWKVPDHWHADHILILEYQDKKPKENETSPGTHVVSKEFPQSGKVVLQITKKSAAMISSFRIKIQNLDYKTSKYSEFVTIGPNHFSRKNFVEDLIKVLGIHKHIVETKDI